MDNKELKIIITGGGSGGHLIPLLPITREIKRQEAKAEILYIGRKEDIRTDLITNLNLPTRLILAGKWRRYFSWQNFSDLIKTTIGLLQSLFIFWQFKPSIIFTKGGFVSVPVILAAFLLKIPIVAHESDVISGISNRIAARWAKVIACGFETRFYIDLPAKKLTFTGIPIREEFIAESQKSKTQALVIGKKKVETKKPLLLIIGASQGAHRINQLILPLLPTLLKSMLIVHVSGRGDYNWLESETKRLTEKEKANYLLYSFISEELPQVLNRADLVVTRAGASSLAEMAIMKKPTIVVPLSTSASNHQWHNAKILEREEAIVLLDERKIRPSDLKITIERLITNKAERNQLSKNISRFAHPEAAKKLAKLILDKAKSSKKKYLNLNIY